MFAASANRATSSRRLRALLGALLSVAALASAASPAAAEEARSAAAFTDSIGIATHTSYSDTPYVGDFATVKQRLLELGVRHIREDLAPERPDQYQRLNELAAAGIRSTLVLGDPNNGIGGLDELLATLKGNLTGAVEAVEGPNEFDTRGGPGWAAALHGYQQHLYAAIKADPALAGLPVLGPSIVQRPNQEAFGDASASLDLGNIHPYPNGAAPEQNIEAYMARGRIAAGAKPLVATETGYNTALGSSDELLPVSEAAMATYVPRLYLAYFDSGIARTYNYELLDEWPDGGRADPQANFGLLRNDLSPKPAFTALRNLIAILNDPAGGAEAPALDYEVSGDTSSLQRLLLRKSDGSYYLALWRAKSVWDPARRADLAVPATRVELEFSRQVSGAERYQPNLSPAALGPVAARDGRLSVDVGAEVVIVRLSVGGELKAGRIKAWLSRRSVPAGGRVAVRGRLPGKAQGRQAVTIQRWRAGDSSWQVIGHARTSRKGTFEKALRVSPGKFGRVSRLRLVSSRTKPSRPLRITIRGAGAKPGLATARIAG